MAWKSLGLNKLVEFIDTHCHLNLENFKNDLDQVIERALENGVTTFIVPGYDLETSRAAVTLAEKYPQVFAAIGIHPNSAFEWNQEILHEFNILSTHPKVAAIGEIGLDFYRNHATPQQQEEALLPQLELAAMNQLPVILHSRKAEQNMIELLISDRFSDVIGVFHAFEGSLEQAAALTSHSFMIGAGGQITYKKNEHHRQLIASIPIYAMILETDAPFLSPQQLRGTRNEPANIPIIADLAARLQNISLPEFAQQTTMNVLKIFQRIGFYRKAV
ncbi:MAG TPA: TatD family hydrolase [Anaerolineaceae bacterium]|nr:TatD family hydrolase [Anaerolineaceae bacterium]